MKFLLVLPLLFTLTACGGSEEIERATGLLPEAAPTATPTETLPDPPINTLVPDLTTPEGVAKAYVVYLSLGESLEACDLVAPSLMNTLGGTSACQSRVEEYGADVVYDFDDSLDVANNVTVAQVGRKGKAVKVSAVLSPSEESGLLFAEGMTLARSGEKWLIVDLESIRAEQTQDPE